MALGSTVSSCSSSASEKEADYGQILFIGDNIALADTQYGKVKGYQLRGINYFLGILSKYPSYYEVVFDQYL